MTVSRTLCLSFGLLTGATLTLLLPGCGSSESVASKPIGVSDASTDNPLRDITYDNESANMNRIKKAGEGKK